MIAGGDGGNGGDADTDLSSNVSSSSIRLGSRFRVRGDAVAIERSDGPGQYDPVLGGGGGGGGGGGYGAVFTGTSLNVFTGDTLKGGGGGNGGSGYYGNGGDGGAGGVGLFAQNGASITNEGSISGGYGGAGGGVLPRGSSLSYAVAGQSGSSTYGNGGAGGVGLFAPNTSSIINTGTISGGNGGESGALPLGSSGLYSAPGLAGAGGIGIIGQNLTIDDSGGRIQGGLDGNANKRAPSIELTGDINSLTLNPSSRLLGDILLGGALTITSVGDVILDSSSIADLNAGQLMVGSVVKDGMGSLTLKTNNTYSGATTVMEGSLIVDGSIASTVMVDGGATLGGSGSVGPVTALPGAVIRPGPGNAYQTLTVNGAIMFQPGSIYRVKINPAGETDRIVATGGATLGGATLAVEEATGSYTNILSPYTILTASNISGRFGSVASANGLPFVDPTVVYGEKTVTLTFVRNDTPLPSVAITPNQLGPAGAIQNAAPAPPTNNSVSPAVPPVVKPRRDNPGPVLPVRPQPVPTPDVPIQQVLYNAVLGQTPTGAQQAFRSVAGTLYASQTASEIRTSRYVSVNVLDRLFSITGSGLDARQLLDQLSPNALPTFINCFAPLPSVEKLVPQNVTFWGDGFGSFGKTNGNANAAGLDHSLGGFILGADAPLHGFSAPYRLGIAGGYTNDSFSSRGGDGSGTAESYFGTLYGSARYGSIDVRLGTSFAATQTTASRVVAFPGFFESEHGRYWGNTVQGFGEVGYRLTSARAVIEPVLDAAVVHIHQDSFRETGGVAALIGYAEDTDSASTTLGVRAEAALFNGLPLIARTFLGWRHGYGDINPAATFAFATGSTPFSSSGAPIDRDALAAEAGLDWRASSRLTLGASYVGEIGARATDNAVRGRLEYKF